VRVFARHFLVLSGLSALLACRAVEPTGGLVERCVRDCNAKASRSCSDAECVRGCEFILDRLVEKETKNVLACVARKPRRCTDVVWAECAAHIGAHADGGPPPPPPPEEYE
jgi:hypothetical protein